MNSIVLSKFEEGLNPYNYAASLMQRAKETELISNDEYASFLMECNELIKQQVMIENNFKSSCIKESIADEIVGSFFYVLDYGLRKMEYLECIELLKESVRVVYEKHQKEMLVIQKATKQLYLEVCLSKININQKVYNELYNGKLYQGISRVSLNHVKNLNLDYDYQILNYDSRGNDLLSVKLYLEHLLEENNFIKKYNEFDLQWLFENYEKQYNDKMEDSFVNLLELVILNSTINIMLNRSGLKLTTNDLEQLENINFEEEINDVFEMFESPYLSSSLKQLKTRMLKAYKNHTLVEMVVVESDSNDELNSGVGMSNEEFQKAYRAMEYEKDLGNQIKTLKENIHCFADFVDLVEAFDFSEEELIKVFNSFDLKEREYLYRMILKEYRIGQIEIDEDDVNELWEKVLIKVIRK